MKKIFFSPIILLVAGWLSGCTGQEADARARFKVSGIYRIKLLK